MMSSSLQASLDRYYLTDVDEPGAVLLRLLDAAPDALVAADHTGTIAFVNKQAEQLFGYSRTEMLGQMSWRAAHVVSDSPARAENIRSV